MSAELQRRVERLLFDYADTLDQKRFIDWPAFFSPDTCDYRVVSRENYDADLTAPLMGCYTHGMVKDRVAMLIADSLTYQKTNQRRYVSNVRVDRLEDGMVEARSNLLVMQCDFEGNLSTYMVGRCDDVIVEREGGLTFSRRTVIVDSFSIDNVLAVPL
jgi:anthranilate 1,2-dioxygenase small subunit